MSQPPPPRAPGLPSPGWYHDGVGIRWWDGGAWGSAAPPPGPSSDDKALSILCHGGVFLGGLVLPLVMYLIANDRERPETRWHAREALNFQLTFLAAYFASFVLFFVGLVASGAFAAVDSTNPVLPGAGIGIGFFGLFGFIGVSVVCNFVFSIIAAVRANNGVRWKYPIRIPFVKA